MRKFLTEVFTQEEANVVVFGVPLGKFGKASLSSLRDASWFVEPYDLDRKTNLLENARVFDSGDLKLASFQEINQRCKKILESGKIPLMLGGNHLSSMYSLQAFKGDTKLVVFDAHCDLKSGYIDERLKEMGKVGKKSFVNGDTNDATWLRKLCETRNPKNVMLLGVRSADEDELRFMKDSGILYYTSEDIRERMDEVRLILHQFTRLSSVYISLDMDVFDPGIAPAVDYPEPDGIYFRHFKGLMGSVNGRLAGLDMCCLKPIKNSQVTEALAVRSIFEILGKI